MPKERESRRLRARRFVDRLEAIKKNLEVAGEEQDRKEESGE